MMGADEAQREQLRMSSESYAILDSSMATTAPQPVNLERDIRREKHLKATEARIEAGREARSQVDRQREDKLALRQARREAKAGQQAEREQRRAARDQKLAARGQAQGAPDRKQDPEAGR